MRPRAQCKTIAKTAKVNIKLIFSLYLLIFSGSVLAMDPSPPANLNHSVYSRSSAEIFWDRSDTFGLIYEVSRNNSLLAITDGISHYDNQLTGDTEYTYEVIAVDLEGRRSSVASTTLRTKPGVRSQINEPVENPITTPVSTPVNTPVTTPGNPTTPSADDIAVPTGLTARVYSKRTIELFWDRPNDFGLKYEIFRDDALVKTTNGVSFYESKLTPGTKYTYQVVAVDTQNKRSAPAVVTLTTQSASNVNAVNNVKPVAPVTSPDPVVTPEPPTTVPTTPSANTIAVPTGLKASVYSKRSIELFWNRPTVNGLKYEVFRDGALIRTTEGISFYENKLTPGTTYTYQVVAISSQNERSAPAAIMLNTPTVTGSSTVEPVTPVAPVTPVEPTTPLTPVVPVAPVAPVTPVVPTNPVVPVTSNNPVLAEPTDLFTRDGYAPFNVLRVDLRTVIGSGPCNADDESGCTLADVMADTDKHDDHTVDIKVHFQSDDFADDGETSNATLRLRGGGSRFAAQKSFRIKLDSKKKLWRGERHLQLNKHPFDSSRVRNKIAMDIMSIIPDLPSMRTQYVNLWIDNGNGPVDYGLFTHVEKANKYFLRNREWNDDDRIYKAGQFLFTEKEISYLQIDDEGEPIDKDVFERTLEIENGDDHRNLVAMLKALHDSNRSYQSVLDQYFDRDNVMAWVAANILLRQDDAVRHNFILYNPVDSEKFYFVPWDYDAAVGTWRVPPNDLSNDSLRQRLKFGYALGARNEFMAKFYSQPGIHNEIVQAVENLRQNYVSDESLAKWVNSATELVPPYQYREPDILHNKDFSEYSISRLVDVPRRNEEALRSEFGLLMGPVLNEPTLVGSQWRFSWRPAQDVTETVGAITYRLQISRTPTFDANSIFIELANISDTPDVVVQNINADQLPSGEHFARLIATPANEPERNWQVSANKLYYNNQTFYGALQFDIP